MFNDSRLFTAHGPIVNQRETFDSSGVGYYMADFLASRMYEHHLTIKQCVILAAYILFQAKEHVEGCGGDSHIAVLREDGVSGLVGWKNVETITEILKLADKETGNLLIQLADLDMTETQFKTQADTTLDILSAVREHHRNELKESVFLSDMIGSKKERDSLGLIQPSSTEESDPKT